MRKRVPGLLLVGSAVLAAGYYYYHKLDAKIVRLNPENLAGLEAQTAEQNESFIPDRSEPRRHKPPNPSRNVYFGDVHVHMALSFDSYLFGNRNGLDAAYRFAQGQSMTLKSGEVMRLSRPLDFVAMTDHAESFSLYEGCAATGLTPRQKDFCHQFDQPSVAFFRTLRAEAETRPPERSKDLCRDTPTCVAWENSTWSRIKAAADRYNNPGDFTAFIAYEYSPPLPQSGKVHRNVIFRSSSAPEHAYSAYDAVTTLDLWRALETNCRVPCEFLTIPHNMNKMWGGIGYSGFTIDGDPYREADWALRDRSEPLAEIFQTKGASECFMGAGAVDEECAFEQAIPLCKTGQTLGCVRNTSFAREGLKQGLLLEQSLGFNPLRFGIVAATDTHNGNAGDTEEWDFRGGNGLLGSPARKRLSAPNASFKSGIERTPGGLAAVWAEENTRDSLFTAMQRREAYGTSGTRIMLRFFGGWRLPESLAQDGRISLAYRSGVPMGAVLPRKPPTDDVSPTFLVWAMQDSFSAPLQRIQMIKGWVEGSETYEHVADIACSDGLVPDAQGRCPDNGAQVDLNTCAYSSEVGSPELKILWQDPDFNATASAFYYVRVLENPSCRWSTYDAIRLGVSPRADVPATIQERAWSSPIWYRAKTNQSSASGRARG